jgi:DNA-binding MarR family transcriptional regulator
VLAEVDGDLDEAVRLHERAAAAWKAYGHLPEQGLALLGAGRCPQRLGRPQAAARLRAALAVFDRLGAGPLREEAGALLPGRRRWRRGLGQPALARWLVLEAIQDRPATVAQVAGTLHLARQGVQRLADVLVRDGLAAYEENPAHRRAKLVRITPPGRTALRTIQTAQAAWADVLGAKIGEEELRQASILLDRVLHAVGH